MFEWFCGIRYCEASAVAVDLPFAAGKTEEDLARAEQPHNQYCQVTEGVERAQPGRVQNLYNYRGPETVQCTVGTA